MNKTSKFLISFTIAFAIFLILLFPVFSFAAEDPSAGLVPCGKSATDGTISKPCDFEDFMKLINTVIKFILFYLAVPIAAIMFVYAGFLMVTSGGSTESKTKAKNIFFNAVIGLVLAAAAWLIVRTLLSILGYKDIGLFF